METENLSKKEEEFFDFVYNRQLIWHKRFILGEKPPWTLDSILQKYKIINVYRELDKGTIYVIDKLKGIKDRKIILLNVVFYRFFNRLGLYENLGIPLIGNFSNQKELFKKSLANLKERGPIFNDAYLIAGKENQEKYISVLDSILWLWKNADEIISRIDKCKCPEESFEIIKEISLVGNFLAYEIWTDLTYFNFFKKGWTDDDFVNIGPGAKWGLEMIYGKFNKNQGLRYLKNLYNLQSKALEKKKNPSWKEIAYKGAFVKNEFLSLGNIENALCEFRKYTNLRNGKGKRRYFKSV